MESAPLAAHLLRGADWFNEALLAELQRRGWPKLTRNQAQLFPVLTDAGVSKSEIARRLGVTRQSVSTLVRDLVAAGVLDERTDRNDARLVLVVLTDRGHRLSNDAADILSSLEAVLAARIGADAMTALQRATQLDWGPAPTSPDESMT